MKKILSILLFIFILLLSGSIAPVFSEEQLSEQGVKDENSVLQGGISVIEQVPESFYGNWRVSAKLGETSSPATFKPTSIDIWNLSREGDVINLCNPFTGASASITVSYVDNNIIKFTKVGNYDNKKLTDTVELKLEGDTFTGINKLTLETISDVDNTVLKEENAVYILKGEKISGTSISDKQEDKK